MASSTGEGSASHAGEKTSATLAALVAEHAGGNLGPADSSCTSRPKQRTGVGSRAGCSAVVRGGTSGEGNRGDNDSGDREDKDANDFIPCRNYQNIVIRRGGRKGSSPFWKAIKLFIAGEEADKEDSDRTKRPHVCFMEKQKAHVSSFGGERQIQPVVSTLRNV